MMTVRHSLLRMAIVGLTGLAVTAGAGAAQSEGPAPLTPPAVSPPAAPAMPQAPLVNVPAKEQAAEAAAAPAAAQITAPADPPVDQGAAAPQAGMAGVLERAGGFLRTGGPAIWVIAALSVLTLTLILWKVWRLILMGAWSRQTSLKAVAQWEAGDAQGALAMVAPRRGMRSRFCTAMMQAARGRPLDAAREEATRNAREILSGASGGLRALELIATIAPLLGLLGTVLGMISAFQALQEAGNRADPALLAGGIWEALLTTAAGMAVAIPASIALTWFEAVIDRVREDMESFAARIFVHQASIAPSRPQHTEAAQPDTAQGQSALVAQ